MLRGIVELIWVASMLTFGWSATILLVVGLPTLLIGKVVKSSEVAMQARSMGHFVVWWTGIFAYLGMLGMLYSYLVTIVIA